MVSSGISDGSMTKSDGDRIGEIKRHAAARGVAARKRHGAASRRRASYGSGKTQRKWRQIAVAAALARRHQTSPRTRTRHRGCLARGCGGAAAALRENRLKRGDKAGAVRYYLKINL